MTKRNHGGYQKGSYGYQMWELQYKIWDLIDSLPLLPRTLIIGWYRATKWFRNVTGIERRARQRELDEQWMRIGKAWLAIMQDIGGE
jgi:hypothetical protein